MELVSPGAYVCICIFVCSVSPLMCIHALFQRQIAIYNMDTLTWEHYNLVANTYTHKTKYSCSTKLGSP